MKKSILIVAILLLLIAAVVISVLIVKLKSGESGGTDNSKESILKNDSFEGYAFYCNYLSKMEDTKKDQKKIITNHKELETYVDKYNDYIYDGHGNKKEGKMDRLLEKYDDKYFKDHNLALLYVKLSSGSYSIKFVSAKRDNNAVEVAYEVVRPKSQFVTDDMSGYIIAVEVDKDINDITISKDK